MVPHASPTRRYPDMMTRPWPTTTLVGVVVLSLLVRFTTADCECGYSIQAADDDTTHVFTDLFESDFVHVNLFKNAVAAQRVWAPQEYNITSTEARGPYGKLFDTDDVVSDTVADLQKWSSGSDKANGVQLVVRGNVVDDMVQGAEMSTTDLDYFYGTYRVGLKVTDVPGTCTAFFWYFNDTQEIDMEFLSSEFNKDNNSYPINLVLQTPESKSAGYDASKTGSFKKINLSFDPTAADHEYRFDYLQDRVLFYADDNLLATMDANIGGVPTEPGHLIVSHWSNGDPGWSRGPPTSDAASVVRYVKAYFNSSTPARENDFAARCSDPGRDGAVCAVPTHEDATFFFSYNANMTVNQTTYDSNGNANGSNKNDAGRAEAAWRPFVLALTLGSIVAWAAGLL